MAEPRTVTLETCPACCSLIRVPEQVKHNCKQIQIAQLRAHVAQLQQQIDYLSSVLGVELPRL